jgi:hypothetical protein
VVLVLSTVVVCVLLITVVKVRVDAESRRNTLSNYVSSEESIYYTSIQIHSNDTLTSISQDIIDEYQMDVPVDVMITNISRINSIGNPDRIKSGTYVVVPYIK